MPNTREKLIELVDDYTEPLSVRDIHKADFAENFADHLIANGVTVQQWIPVSERLPEYEEPVMGWDAEMRDMGIVNFIYGRFLDILDMSETNVTHWMPLPEPPKESADNT